MTSQTYGGSRYFCATTSADQRYTRVHPLETRDGVEEYLSNLIRLMERNTSLKEVVRVHADNASEFLSIRRGLEKKGIALTTSSIYTL